MCFCTSGCRGAGCSNSFRLVQAVGSKWTILMLWFSFATFDNFWISFWNFVKIFYTYTRVFDIDVIKWTRINFFGENRVYFSMYSLFSLIQRVQRSLNFSIPSITIIRFVKPSKIPFCFPLNFFVRLKTPTTQPSLKVWEQIIVAGGPGMENTVDAEVCAMFDVWDGALLSWKLILFFKCVRFFPILSTNRSNNAT